MVNTSSNQEISEFESSPIDAYEEKRFQNQLSGQKNYWKKQVVQVKSIKSNKKNKKKTGMGWSTFGQ